MDTKKLLLVTDVYWRGTKFIRLQAKADLHEPGKGGLPLHDHHQPDLASVN